MTDLDVDAVTRLVEHVAATVVAPRFRALVAGEVSEKGPGDLVTVVDTESEAALTRGLADILRVPVVGEEATSARPETLDVLRTARRAWLVDPLDGTRAFVEGNPDHAVMVALVEHGEAVAGWICLPEHGLIFAAQRGAGAYLNGRRLRGPHPVGPLRGGIATFYLGPDVADRVTEAVRGLGSAAETNARLWSGAEYSRLARGEHDFAVYARTWPWDHGPGAVILRETGGVSRWLDGTDYRPDGRGEGFLIVAGHPETYGRVSGVLRPALG